MQQYYFLVLLITFTKFHIPYGGLQHGLCTVLCIYMEPLKYIVIDPDTSSPLYLSTIFLITCFTIEVGNSSSNSKTKNITNYTHQEDNIMELLLT